MFTDSSIKDFRQRQLCSDRKREKRNVYSDDYAFKKQFIYSRYKQTAIAFEGEKKDGLKWEKKSVDID